jgi:hypothetical protein
MLTSLLNGVFFLNCVSDDNQDDIRTCSQEIAIMFTSLLQGCSFLTFLFPPASATTIRMRSVLEVRRSLLCSLACSMGVLSSTASVTIIRMISVLEARRSLLFSLACSMGCVSSSVAATTIRMISVLEVRRSLLCTLACSHELAQGMFFLNCVSDDN